VRATMRRGLPGRSARRRLIRLAHARDAIS